MAQEGAQLHEREEEREDVDRTKVRLTTTKAKYNSKNKYTRKVDDGRVGDTRVHR